MRMRERVAFIEEKDEKCCFAERERERKEEGERKKEDGMRA